MSTSTGTDLHSNGDPNISLPFNSDLNIATNSHHLRAINPDLPPRPSQLSPAATIDPTIYPGGTRSLSTISLYGFLLGTVLSASLLLSIILFSTSNPLWRLPQFLATLSLFHFLEFYSTARYNTLDAKVSSYLLSTNGNAYRAAHTAAFLEIIVTAVWFPGWQARWCNTTTLLVGLVAVVVGQATRSVAMAQAGTNFNHIPARSKKRDHELVTRGLYAWMRHPSYFGYFVFAVGTQVVVGNKVCGLVYLGVLWNFFRVRIREEEIYLVQFFGKDYLEYRKRAVSGIPFVR